MVEKSIKVNVERPLEIQTVVGELKMTKELQIEEGEATFSVVDTNDLLMIGPPEAEWTCSRGHRWRTFSPTVTFSQGAWRASIDICLQCVVQDMGEKYHAWQVQGESPA